MLLHQDVEGVLHEARRDARGMADADRPEALGEAELEQVVHRGVAGRGAEDPPWRAAAPRATSASTVLLPVPGGPWTQKTVPRSEGALHGEALLRVQGVEVPGRVVGLEARWLLAEEHLAAPARGAPIAGGDLDDRGVGPSKRDVVRHQVEHEPSGADELGWGTVEGELDGDPAAPGDERALGRGDLGAPGPGLHHVAGAERVPPRLSPGAGEGDEEAASEAHVLVGGLEVPGGEAERLALTLGEAGPLAGEAFLLRASLAREELTQPVEVLGSGRSGGHASSCQRAGR